jgi:parallel beta-helix repeat protein
LIDAASSNQVGNGTVGGRNIISGNNGHGFEIGGNSHYNKVHGNYIGLNAGGTGAIGNGQNGLQLVSGPQYNQIGSTEAARRNVISGNGSTGIVIGNYASSNEVLGNYIGTDPAGTAAVANNNDGIHVEGADCFDNRIGDGTVSGRNLVAGNREQGIYLYGVSNNYVLGNYVGCTLNGNVRLPNWSGLVIVDGAKNHVGNGTAGGRNLFSGNNNCGIEMYGTNSNEVLGNYIGVDASGTAALANNSHGIFMNGRYYNRIGDGTPGGRNLISGNGGSGLFLQNYIGYFGPPHDNRILGNYIGLGSNEVVIGNGQYGISLSSDSAGNLIGQDNKIAGNSQGGIRIADANSQYNTITQNSLFGNNGPGIILTNGSNNGLAAPVITSAGIEPVTGSTEVRGTAPAGSTIELFTTGSQNPSGYYEGRTYVASTVESGGWVFVLPPLAAGTTLCATATDANGNTSQFSAAATAAGWPTVALIAPNGGELWSKDANESISWSYSGVPGLKINLYYSLDGGITYPHLITTEANNSSPYTWHTPDVETNEARVRIEAVKVGYITSDESTANFSLTAPILQVINTNDDGEGSLRQVMTYANTLPGFTRVTFNIPNGLATTEGGVKFWRIKPISGPLPAITREGIVIDGTTQPTDETYNNPFGPEIVLDGLAVSGSGLEITAAYCTIEGLVVNRFGDYGIYLNQAAHGDVLGNFIGTDASGTIAQGNSDGIRAKQSPYARIGDGTTTGRNLISGNSSAGIRIHDGSPSSEVKGNYVGTDVSGAVPLGNAEGVRVGNSGYVLIGGSLTGEGNLISGNNGRGIVLGNSGAQYIRIRGNLIGTNVSGTAALQNGSDGIYCFNNSSRNQIGGVTTGEGNLISGNNENGIFFDDDEGYNEVLGNIIGGNASGTIAVPNRLDGIRVRYSTDNRVGNGTAVGRNLIIGNESYDVNTGSAGIRLAGDTFNTIVRGNYIGTDISGTAGLGTFVEGIRLGQNTGCRIGGRNSGEGNVIYGCVRKGIAFGNNTQRTTVEGNTIWHNKGSGIAFEDRGSCSLNTIGPANTIAHNGDGSSPDQYGIWIDGANNIRNTITRNSFYDNYDQAIKLTNSGNANLSAPTIITAEGGSGLVTGEAPANSVVELYLTGAPDPTGSGEGRTYIGSVEANGSGQWSITLVGLTARTTLTATATDTNGNTSAFAVNLVTVQGISPYEVTNTNDSGDGSLRQCILNANANPGSHTITFNIPNSASTTEGGVTFWRIAAPWTQLDVTRAGTVIDGTTQPTDEAHHNPYGPEIVLAQVGEFGGWYNAAINLHADHCTVEGLNIAGAFDGGYGFGYGIFLDNTRGCHIIGNYLGTNPTGEGIGGNSMDGVYISGGSGNVIGGSAPGEGNLISSNFVSAIIFDSTSSNEVRGNYIGTDRTGQRRLDAHLYGAIQLLNDSFGNLIGGAGSGERNIISGSGADALSLTGNARGNLIIGNYIGLGSGEEELGNVGDGVQCDGSGVKYNTVSRNRIYGNVGEAILLSGGANESIAAPAITSAIFNGDTGSIEVIGTVTAAGTIELFLAGPRGYPEGRTFLAATAESGGSWRIDLPNLASGTALSATVTDVNGNTSQFSAVALVSGPPVATVVSPNGGESYRRDSDQLISWSYAGVPGGKINLYYSLDNGASYPFTITTEAENASPYTWHTPDLETTEARVRIEAVLGSYINTDESNAKFSIVTPVLVVNRTANSGEGSLRQVITYANTLPGFYRVTFNIPTSEATFDGGVYYWKIMPTSPLPVIARAGVVVDGTTQPTDETYNNPLGPEIVLDGTMAGPTSGLVVSGVTHCTIEGLTINRFAAGESGIRLNSAGSCEVYGCYLGTNATGTAAAPNVYGLTLNSSPHCVLGAPGRGNRISGNYSTGLSVSNSDDLTMLGNYLGTNAAGTQRLPNSYGAYFSNSSGCRIGDGTPGGRNVFAGNNAPEVALNGSNNVIQGNYFGLGVNGEALGNTAPGLMIDSGSNNLIGPGNVFANHVYGVGAFAPNGNVITRNSFYNHYAIGIGSNQTAPQGLYAGINPLTGSLEVGGTATANGTIELYEAVGPTPWAQAYEGKVYLDSTYEASGAWKFVYSPDFLTQGTTLTATVTTANGTSMFANKTYVYGLPTVEVTVPAAGGSYPNGFDLALNWVVRGVPLDTVNIYYSLDGGATYPYTITREAVNNLSYNWPVPVVNTDEARIKVEAMKGSYTTTTESGIFTILTPVLKVTNTADSGEGSLRQVLTYANTLPGFYRVTFDLPTSEATVAGGAAYWRITPASQLPTLGRDGIVIDGTTQPARGSFYNPYGPEIVIDGQDTVDIGIPIQASACTVEGLVIHRFTANGIYIGGVSNCRIAGNYIGTDHTGIGSRANAGDGALKLENSVSTLVENNVISGNTNAGFDLTNASGSRIVNNYIGCAANGVSALANGTDGINLNNNSAGNLVGANNRIWFNTRNGVRIDGGSTAHNTISQASIYGNGEPGIILENGANEGILAPTIVAANVIPGLGLTEITGEAVAGATIELFATGTPDPSGSGEGWGYLGSTYEASGVWTIQVSGLTRGATVTATATNNNNTSQFAANFTAAANFIPLSIARAADTAGSDIVVSWDEPAVPDIYLLTGAGEGVYTDATTGWTKVTNPTAAGFTQSGSELHHTAQVRGGTTESYYKALPAGADIDGLLSTEAVGKFNISLTGGNNLFSLPLIPDNTAIGGGATLGSQLFGLSPRVYKFEPLTGYTVAYESGGSWAGSLTTLAADSGYWIKLNGARVITVIGRPSGIARSIPIKGTSRSNLLGSAFPRTVGLAATALNSALTTSDKVYGYRDGSFQIGYYTGANTWGGSLNAYGLEPGRGYWGVKNSSGDAVWVYPKPY